MGDKTIAERMAKSGLTHGPVTSYLIDAGLISPGEAQIEAIEFHADIAPSGLILGQSPSIRIQPGYSFLFSGLYGASSHAETADEDLIVSSKLHLVSFNVMNEGRNKAVFRRPIPINILTCPGGPAHDIQWHSIFRFFESADISVDWFVDPLYSTGTPAVASRFTVLLIGDIVNDSVLPRVER